MDELVRYSVQWYGPAQPICLPMPDGYWTSWHVATAKIDDMRAEREPRDYEYVFTPTGNELPPLLEHLAHLESMLGPITRISAGLTLEELIEREQMIPNHRARFCTRVLKIEPSIKYMAALPPGSVLYVGLRADEEEREGIYGDTSCDFPFRRWGWGLKEVWAFLDARGITVPPRTDCAWCYEQRLSEWWHLRQEHPDVYQRGVNVEQRYGHTFRSPSRDTWPAALDELRREFDSGRVPRGTKMRDDLFGKGCGNRVCSL